MFELEIMVTGYTILVVSTTVTITKYFEKKEARKYSFSIERSAGSFVKG